MEELYRRVEKINIISLYKNYSNIQDRFKSKSGYSLFTMYPSKFKHRGFFYGNKNDEYYDSVFIKGFNNIRVSDEKIKKYFNNPFANIICRYTQTTLVKNGNELTLRLFYHDNTRNFNSRYIKKTQVSFGVKFNLKTGNFIVFDKDNRNKNKNKMIFNTNNFIL